MQVPAAAARRAGGPARLSVCRAGEALTNSGCQTQNGPRRSGCAAAGSPQSPSVSMQLAWCASIDGRGSSRQLDPRGFAGPRGAAERACKYSDHDGRRQPRARKYCEQVQVPRRGGVARQNL